MENTTYLIIGIAVSIFIFFIVFLTATIYMAVIFWWALFSDMVIRRHHIRKAREEWKRKR